MLILLASIPGFNSTKGPEEEIYDSYCQARAFENGNKIKILLVVERCCVFGSRGNAVVDSFCKLIKMFSSNILQVVQSTAIVITKTNGKVSAH
jgi:hypothetical protein